MANTAQTVEREAPQAAEVKWQKPSNFKRFLKRAWDCKILLAMLLPALTLVVCTFFQCFYTFFQGVKV